MNKEAAVSLLWNRVKAKLRCRCTDNLAAPLHCLCCGERPAISERVNQTHVFCGTRCQRELHGLDGFLSLGMKRGLAGLEETVPDFAALELPYDVLIVLLVRAYDHRLMSISEYEQLLSMRLVNEEFRHIIDEIVIPGITFLCGEILQYITTYFDENDDSHSLRQFTGLETFMAPLGAMTELYAGEYLTDRKQFVNLKSLVLFDIDFTEFSRLDLSIALPRLEKLRLYEVDISDRQMGHFVSLTSLDIQSCPSLSDAPFSFMTNLKRLRLTDMTMRRYNLNALTQLTELCLNSSVDIADAGVQHLANLISLKLANFNDNQNAVFRMNRLSNQCLAYFPQLKSLKLHNYSGIPIVIGQDPQTGAFVESALETLDISGPLCETHIANIGYTPNLTYLNLGDRDYAGPTDLDVFTRFKKLKWFFPPRTTLPLGGAPFTFKMPDTLETLVVSTGMVFIGDKYRKHLAAHLKVLHVLDEVGGLFDEYFVEKLAHYGQLEVLTLANNPAIFTNDDLSQLTSLRELTLINMAKSEITYNGVRALPRLKYLYVKNTRLHKKQLDALREKGVTVFDESSVIGVDELPPRYYDRPFFYDNQ